jgi:NAD(P)H-quinone oxidoreductase subunit 4L
MTLELFLLMAAGLFCVGLFGALSQQSVVMLMMGLELMANGLLLAAGAFWWFVNPTALDGQVLLLLVLVVMAVEMAMGFGVTTAIFRARDVDLTDSAADLRG